MTQVLPRSKEMKSDSLHGFLAHKLHTILKYYSNIHRGSGLNARATEIMYNRARKTVLQYLKLKEDSHAVVFSTTYGAKLLTQGLSDKYFRLLSSSQIGMSLDVVAVVFKKNGRRKPIAKMAGGGTARLTAVDWVVESKGLRKYEAGTPAIVNAIVFALALHYFMQQEDVGDQKMATMDNISLKLIFKDDYSVEGKTLLEQLKKDVISNGNALSGHEPESDYVHLDNSASTRTFRPVADAYLQTLFASPKVQHEISGHTRNLVRTFFNAPDNKYNIRFVQNTTEGINIIAGGKTDWFTDHDVVLTSLAEHTSNDLPWRMHKYNVDRLAIDNHGLIDPILLEQTLIDYNVKHTYGDKRIKLVAITAVSNVLGMCNNLKKISEIAHRYGALLMVDAAQWVAHKPLDILDYDLDIVVFSGHKLYAPFGSGAIIYRNSLPFPQAPKTENAAGIAAMGKAISLLNKVGMDIVEKDEKELCRYALSSLADIQGITIYGLSDPKDDLFQQKLGVFAFNLKNMMARPLAARLSHYGIGIRAGCHCAHILVKHILKVSPGLEKFQRFIVSTFPITELPGVARISIGLENSKEDIDACMGALRDIASGNAGKKDVKAEKTLQQNAVAIAEMVYSN